MLVYGSGEDPVVGLQTASCGLLRQGQHTLRQFHQSFNVRPLISL